jgi:3-oxoacyl-[acyl-carrier protein] reductase
MDLGLRERRALVMGGSRGLGNAVAKTLVAEGARVAICARDAGRVASTAAELGVTGLVTDLSVPGAAATVIREAERHLGHLDILIVNTGGPPPGLFADLSDTAWHTAFEQLWMSSVGAIRFALPGMRARRSGPCHRHNVDRRVRAGPAFDAFGDRQSCATVCGGSHGRDDRTKAIARSAGWHW